MIIRGYQPGDIESIGRVHAISRRAAYGELLPPEALARITPGGQADYWRERLSSEPEPHSVFVIEADGVISGFALGTGGGDTGTLSNIHVLPHLHGTGAGQMLHDRILAEFRAWECTTALLWVLEGNERAQSFYRRNGWALDGARDNAVVGGAVVPVVRYARPLRNC